jgi:rod shape-determining protein MreD
MYSVIKQLLLFFVLVFLQVCLFDKIHLFGCAIPLLYIYFVIQLPWNMNRSFVLLLSALIGLCIDTFNCTLGLNMFACVIVGFLRFYLLQLFVPNSLFENYCHSVVNFGEFGFFYYLYYSASMTLLHQIVLCFAESSSLSNPLSLIFRVVGSFVLTMLLIFAFDRIKCCY